MITITQTMYDKSCIDCNKTVRDYLTEVCGSDMFTNPFVVESRYNGEFYAPDDDYKYLKPFHKFVGDTIIRVFYTKKRKDPRVSFKNWKKYVKVGDTLHLEFEGFDSSIKVIIDRKN